VVIHHTRNFGSQAAFTSGMNIAAKEQLYEGFRRVLRRGGWLVLQEPMAGPVQPAIFPVMWARDATSSFLRSPQEMRVMIEARGFRARVWEDVTLEVAGSRSDEAVSIQTIQELVMGDTLAAIGHAGRRNRDEGRIVMIQAVFDRP